MKRWKVIFIGALAGLLSCLVSHAASLRPLLEEESVKYGGNFIYSFKYTDFSSYTTTNVATLTNFPILAKQGVECVAYYLNKAFGSSSSTTGSVSLFVKDVSNVTNLTATEMNADGAAVYLKYGTSAQTVYTNNSYMQFIFTPSNESLNTMTNGEGFLIFRIKDARNP